MGANHKDPMVIMPSSRLKSPKPQQTAPHEISIPVQRPKPAPEQSSCLGLQSQGYFETEASPIESHVRSATSMKITSSLAKT